MPYPQKIPKEYAAKALAQHNRGYDDDDVPDILAGEVFGLSEDDCLISVAKLKKFFRTYGDYVDFKNKFVAKVPDEEWQMAQAHCGNKTAKRYASSHASVKGKKKGKRVGRRRSCSSSSGGSSRSRSASPANRKRLKMKAWRRGYEQSSDEDDDISILRISKSARGCDAKDVNLPAPICKGIRKVCRYYGPDRRYRAFGPDNSEKHVYDFGLSYKRRKK